MHVFKNFFTFILIATGFIASVQARKIDERNENGVIYTYYENESNLGTYQKTTDWCKQLNGNLPILRNQNDLDFWEKLISRLNFNSKTQPFIGLLKKDKCDTWIDDSPLELPSFIISDCEECTESCCALVVSSNSNHMVPCSEKRHQICEVIGDKSDDEEQGEEPEKDQDIKKDILKLKEDLENLSSNLKSHKILLKELDERQKQDTQSVKEDVSSLRQTLTEKVDKTIDEMTKLKEPMEKITQQVKNLEEKIEKEIDDRRKQENAISDHETRLQSLEESLKDITLKQDNMTDTLQQLKKEIVQLNETINLPTTEHEKKWWSFVEKPLYSFSVAATSMVITLVMLLVIIVKTCCCKSGNNSRVDAEQQEGIQMVVRDKSSIRNTMGQDVMDKFDFNEH